MSPPGARDRRGSGRIYIFERSVTEQRRTERGLACLCHMLRPSLRWESRRNTGTFLLRVACQRLTSHRPQCSSRLCLTPCISNTQHHKTTCGKHVSSIARRPITPAGVMIVMDCRRDRHSYAHIRMRTSTGCRRVALPLTRGARYACVVVVGMSRASGRQASGIVHRSVCDKALPHEMQDARCADACHATSKPTNSVVVLRTMVADGSTHSASQDPRALAQAFSKLGQPSEPALLK